MSPIVDENFDQLSNVYPPSCIVGKEDVQSKFAFNLYNLKWNFNFLLGNVLTIIDATGMEEKQLKAVKDLVRGKFTQTMDQLYNEASTGLSSGQNISILPTHPDYGKGRKAKGNSSH